MKFLRQLATVLLVVACVVALGVAWERSSAASWIAAPETGGLHVHGIGYRQTIDGPVPIIGTAVPAGRIRIVRIGGAPVELSNLGDVGRTAEIEASLIAVVVVLDVIRRRARRAMAASR